MWKISENIFVDSRKLRSEASHRRSFFSVEAWRTEQQVHLLSAHHVRSLSKPVDMATKALSCAVFLCLLFGSLARPQASLVPDVSAATWYTATYARYTKALLLSFSLSFISRDLLFPIRLSGTATIRNRSWETRSARACVRLSSKPQATLSTHARAIPLFRASARILSARTVSTQEKDLFFTSIFSHCLLPPFSSYRAVLFFCRTYSMPLGCSHGYYQACGPLPDIGPNPIVVYHSQDGCADLPYSSTTISSLKFSFASSFHRVADLS